MTFIFSHKISVKKTVIFSVFYISDISITYNLKKAAQLFSALIIIKKKMFLEQQINISELFLKDHMTLKARVMMLKIQL